MPSILQGYEYDIFISYRQNDNHAGWVTEFVKQLEEENSATIKDSISIYFDENPHDGLHEHHEVDDSLRENLKCLTGDQQVHERLFTRNRLTNLLLRLIWLR